MNWDEVKCYECPGHCNKKGYPSVTKGSKHCKSQRGLLTSKQKKEHISFVKRIKGWFGR
jgi:hypothetical protein